MVRFLNGEEKCRQKTSSFVKKLGEKCRWMRGKNSGVMKREVWTACLSLKRGLTPQQQQKNPISNLFPSKKRRCSWSIASLFFSLCVSSLIVKMFCCISLSPPLQWLWEVCLYGHFKATFAASSVVHFFFFFWSYSSMPFPIFFDPKCGRNNSSKKPACPERLEKRAQQTRYWIRILIFEAYFEGMIKSKRGPIPHVDVKSTSNYYFMSLHANSILPKSLSILRIFGLCMLSLPFNYCFFNYINLLKED